MRNTQGGTLYLRSLSSFTAIIVVRIKPPRFRPELVEAVLGKLFDHYRNKFSSHELHYFYGLTLVPLLESVLLNLKLGSRKDCSSDLLDGVVEVTVAIARYIGRQESYGNWSLKDLSDHLNKFAFRYGLDRRHNPEMFPRPANSCNALLSILSSVNSHTNPYSVPMLRRTHYAAESYALPMESLLTVAEDVAPMMKDFPASATPTFSTDDLHHLKLLTLGNMRIRWTQFFPKHLQLDPMGTELAVFWDMSLVRWVHSDSRWRPSALFWLPGNSKLYE